MPRSSKSHRHHKQSIPTHLPHKKKRSSSILVFVIFLGALGAGAAFFAAGPDIKWIIIGAVIGVIVGLFIGLRIDKQAEKNEK